MMSRPPFPTIITGLPSPSPTPSPTESEDSSSSSESSSPTESSSSESQSPSDDDQPNTTDPQPTPDPKPVLVLICPTGTNTLSKRYNAMLDKMARDADILFSTSLDELHRIMGEESLANRVRGFVVTDARVMGVDTGSGGFGEGEGDDKGGIGIGIGRDAGVGGGVDEEGDSDGDGDEEMAKLSEVLQALATGTYFAEEDRPDPNLYPCPIPFGSSSANRVGNRGLIPSWSSSSSSARNPNTGAITTTHRGQPLPLPPGDWTVVFAFDFPVQAARHPLRFAKYMAETFGVRWRMCGAAKKKWTLSMNGKALRNMGERVYRGDRYLLRAVFLEGVEEADKVLVVKKGAKVPEFEFHFGNENKCDNGEDGEEGRNGSDYFKDDQSSGKETESTTEGFEDLKVENVEIADHRGWTTSAAAGRNSAVTDDEDTIMPDADTGTDIRREYEADDEAVNTSDSDALNEDSTSIASSEDPNTRIIFINGPAQRGSSRDNRNDNSNGTENFLIKGKEKSTRTLNKHVDDCPVAIHQIKLRAQAEGQHASPYQPSFSQPDDDDDDDGEPEPHGYVGFVGHIGDHRSVASLILGMCAVDSTTPLPQVLQTVLRENRFP